MEKFAKLKKTSIYDTVTSDSIMSNFLIRSIVVFSSICIALLIYFVANVFHVLENKTISIILVSVCFSSSLIISLLPRRFFLEQITTPLYLFGAYVLFNLNNQLDNQVSYWLDTYFINFLFVFMILVSRSYVNVTLSVCLLFYQIINIQLLSDNTIALYFILIFLFGTLLACNVFTSNVLLFLKGNLEKLNGFLLGIIFSIFYLLIQVDFVFPLLNTEHAYWKLNIGVGLTLAAITLPVFYKSILCNSNLVETKFELFIITLLCLAIMSTNLFILLALLVAVICFAYNYKTGCYIGLIALFCAIIYTFASDEIDVIYKLSVLLIAGILLLFLYIGLKINNHETI